MTGEQAGSVCYPGPDKQFPTNIAVDDWGNTIVIGYLMDQVDFGTGPLQFCAYDGPGQPPINAAVTATGPVSSARHSFKSFSEPASERRSGQRRR